MALVSSASAGSSADSHSRKPTVVGWTLSRSARAARKAPAALAWSSLSMVLASACWKASSGGTFRRAVLRSMRSMRAANSVSRWRSGGGEYMSARMPVR